MGGSPVHAEQPECLEYPLTTSTPRATILLVCTANVCRSPLAQYILASGLELIPGFENVKVGSAGIQPAKNGRICELVLSSRSGADWTEFAEQHRSRALTGSKIADAKLILTATAEHRSAVATMVPSARGRTFTLREAAWLGQGFTHDGDSGSEAVEAFAEYANGSRGLRDEPSDRGLFRRRRESGDALSIVDGHLLDARRHRATLVSVSDAAASVGRLLTGTGDDEPATAGTLGGLLGRS